MFYDFLSYSRIGFKPPTETVVQPEVVLGKLDFGPRSGGPVAQAPMILGKVLGPRLLSTSLQCLSLFWIKMTVPHKNRGRNQFPTNDSPSPQHWSISEDVIRPT